MQGVFITGTDTGVGKTRIGVLLAKALYKKNIRVIPRKPVESGCKTMSGALIPADALALKQAAHYEGELREVCRYRFAAPVSPQRAANISNTALTTEQLVKACRHDDEEGFTLVEGAGGFYSPISEDGLNSDLAMALKLPVLLVAEDKLGALNQVLLNIEALDYVNTVSRFYRRTGLIFCQAKRCRIEDHRHWSRVPNPTDNSSVVFRSSVRKLLYGG